MQKLELEYVFSYKNESGKTATQIRFMRENFKRHYSLIKRAEKSEKDKELALKMIQRKIHNNG